MGKNALILRNIISKTAGINLNAIFFVTTNPLDAITHIYVNIAKEFGILSIKIIGSGTTLDTARFRSMLRNYIGVDPQNVHAYVISKHGDSEVLCWSTIDIETVPLEDFITHRNIEFNKEIKNEIDDGVRNAAYKIIEGKGSTYYGVACALVKLVEVINRDNRAVLTVSTLKEDIEGIKNVTLSLLNLIGGEGDSGELQNKT